MENSSSPLETLRQLKEMLDAGTITPAEFEKLKQQLVFSKTEPDTSPVVPAPSFVAPVVPTTPLANEPIATDSSSTSIPDEPAYSYVPPVSAGSAPADTASNPLNLVLIIGGALAVLALVLYLALGNRTSDEHLTSTTQTAADSVNTVEVGPQDEQITLPPAAVPETIRVAPAHPVAPIVRPQPAQTDTAGATTATPATKPAAAPDTAR